MRGPRRPCLHWPRETAVVCGQHSTPCQRSGRLKTKMEGVGRKPPSRGLQRRLRESGAGALIAAGGRLPWIVVQTSGTTQGIKVEQQTTYPQTANPKDFYPHCRSSAKQGLHTVNAVAQVLASAAENRLVHRTLPCLLLLLCIYREKEEDTKRLAPTPCIRDVSSGGISSGVCAATTPAFLPAWVY